jgi:hypothetical protein
MDHVRDLGWPGVAGNVDEMLFDPQSLEDFAAGLPALQQLFDAVREIAAATRDVMGDARLQWLRELPRSHITDSTALVHASPASTWRSPSQHATDAEFESVYGPLGRPIAVYGHIHVPFVRNMAGMMVINSGSVSLSYDGDTRAAYLLLDGSSPGIRRVEYDLEKERKALAACGLPHSEWIARTLVSASPQMP